MRKSIEYVNERDRSGVVRYYHPGAEWWFPLGERYNPADVARFRTWLATRYGSIEKLNTAWEAQFASFDAVAAPRIDSVNFGRGQPGLSAFYSLDEGADHCSWSTASVTSASTA